LQFVVDGHKLETIFYKLRTTNYKEKWACMMAKSFVQQSLLSG